MLYYKSSELLSLRIITLDSITQYHCIISHHFWKSDHLWIQQNLNVSFLKMTDYYMVIPLLDLSLYFEMRCILSPWIYTKSILTQCSPSIIFEILQINHLQHHHFHIEGTNKNWVPFFLEKSWVPIFQKWMKFKCQIHPANYNTHCISFTKLWISEF